MVQTDADPDPAPPADRRAAAGLVLLAGAFGAAAVWSWRKWPDLLVDFGLQLYLPWRLASGAVLYRDASHLNGPLSQYGNAALFHLFGVSATTLFVANLVVAALLVLLVYRFFATRAGAVTATAAGLVVILVFAFGQYVGIGNYNYIAPYCHEATHGLVLSVASILALAAWIEGGREAAAAAAGLCLGLVLLTKPEVFLAAAAAGAAGVWLFLRTPNRPAPRRAVAAYLGAFVLSPALSVAGFLPALGPGDSVRAVFWPWIVLLTTTVAENDFYRWSLGLDQPVPNLVRALLCFWALVTAALVAAWCSRRNLRSPVERVAAGAGLAALAFTAWRFPWPDAGRALPLVALVAVAIQGRDALRGRAPALALWSVFALVLLAKMGINSRIWQYGFTLAMPATVGLIHFVLAVLPRRLERCGVDSRRFRGAALGVLVLGVTRLVLFSHTFYAQKTFAVGTGGDRVLTYRDGGRNPEGPLVAASLEWIAANTEDGDTLAVFPEGPALNYLARRPNPTRYLSFLPEEIQIYGEGAMQRALEATAPDTVLLLHRDTTEHGVRFFGEPGHPGAALRAWIGDRYLPARTFGAEPLTTDLFGLQILVRKR